MSLDKIRKLVEGRIKSEWTQTPFAFANLPYNPERGVSYIEVFVIPGEGSQISLGDNAALNRWFGIIDISVMVPKNTGTHKAFSLASDLIDLFYHFDQEGLVCLTGSMTPFTPPGDWVQYKVTIPFYYDEVK